MSETATPLPVLVGDRPALRFLVGASLWMLGLFGILRSTWAGSHILEPLAGFQEAIARYGLTGPPRVLVTLDCAGADLIALCAGALLAFPVAWARRCVAVAVSVAWILILNSLRIGVLERAAETSAFELLHLFVLPLLIQLGAAACVFGWIWWWTRSPSADGQGHRWSGRPVPRFVLVAGVLLAAYTLLTPFLASSSMVAESAVALTALAAFSLSLLGDGVTASGNLLSTSQGSFLVTAECVLTPLMPIALAGALTVRSTPARRALFVLAMPPLFVGLNLGRLLVLALPVWFFGGPLFLAHGLRQAVVGVACIGVATYWRNGSPGPAGEVFRRAVLSILAAAAAGILAGPLLIRGLLALTSLASPLAQHALTSLSLTGDEQGALAILPAFQMGLLVGLLVARRVSIRWSLGALATLIVVQLALLILMGEFAHHRGAQIPTLLIRGAAIVVPLALAFAASSLSRSRSYERFWHDVGEQFPDLGGAASTDFYRANEIRLFREHLGDLNGRRVFKTDLWDEARNTRILQWVREQGAEVFGADISAPTVKLARAAFERGGLRAALGDVRQLPFDDAAFDLIYSMGTIEHFADSRCAAAEIFRVLKPGGRAVVGVPNRHDPFLRPLLVSALSAVGLYDYGYERSFTRRQIRVLLESVGFEVVSEPAILFIPGWLRMLDLWCHCRCRPLTRVTAPLVSVFVWLDRHVPAVRHYGYLLATVVRRPSSR